MCERCGPFYDLVQHFDEEEQQYWEDQYYAKMQKEHDVKRHLGTGPVQVWAHLRNISGASAPMPEVRQALSNLIARSYVSQDEDLRFHAVGKDL